MTNLAEFLAGTNPTNSASALRITSVVSEGDDVDITWTTAGGATNVVQVTTDEAATTFTDLPESLTIVIGSGDAATNYLDVGGATNAPIRFYRIRLMPDE
jgi:hypothetical protein